MNLHQETIEQMSTLVECWQRMYERKRDSFNRAWDILSWMLDQKIPSELKDELMVRMEILNAKDKQEQSRET